MKKKRNKIIDTTTGLVGGGIAISLGSTVLGKLPHTPASAGVQGGMTTMAGYTPLFATIGAAGIITGQMMKIQKKTKQLNRRKK